VDRSIEKATNRRKGSIGESTRSRDLERKTQGDGVIATWRGETSNRTADMLGQELCLVSTRTQQMRERGKNRRASNATAASNGSLKLRDIYLDLPWILAQRRCSEGDPIVD
jgi:hypothetical protein